MPPAPGQWRRATAFWTLVAFFSLLPDIDSVAGVISGHFGRFHNNLTHSLMFGVAVALVVAGLACAFDRPRVRAWFLLALACCWTHVVLDFFTIGRGVMVFWPFTPRRFESPVKFFYGLHWADKLNSIHHLWTFLNEAAFTCVMLGIIWVIRNSGRMGLRIGFSRR